VVGPQPFDAILFDLDGTLADSAADISLALRRAFEDLAITSVRPVDSLVDGSPLEEIFAVAAPGADPSLFDRFVSRYRAHYQGTGHARTRLYPGVMDTLEPVSTMIDCIGISGQIERIPISEILWIESSQNYTQVYLAQSNKPSLCRHTMAAWKGRLPADLYVRLGRSEIIHLARIQAVRWTSRDVTMVSFIGSDNLLQLGRTSALRLKSIVRDAAARKTI
jgi:hypothetical protein